jgi:hypothetical protein
MRGSAVSASHVQHSLGGHDSAEAYELRSEATAPAPHLQFARQRLRDGRIVAQQRRPRGAADPKSLETTAFNQCQRIDKRAEREIDMA